MLIEITRYNRKTLSHPNAVQRWVLWLQDNHAVAAINGAAGAPAPEPPEVVGPACALTAWDPGTWGLGLQILSALGSHFPVHGSPV